VQHHRRDRKGLVFTAGEQSCIFGELSGVDFAGCDTAQDRVGPGELFALAVLAARELDAGPDAVLLPVLDGALGALPLLRQRAAAQALDPRLGG
jgi:hypothetical protein